MQRRFQNSLPSNISHALLVIVATILAASLPAIAQQAESLKPRTEASARESLRHAPAAPEISAPPTVTAAANWVQAFPATSPSPREDASMVYDAANGTVVFFGGQGVSGQIPTLTRFSDTWVWNGITWTQQFPATVPTGRWGATMSYDASTGNVVLFGGAANNGFLNDTWTWNGVNWIQQFPASSPPVRCSASMEYDPATGNLVLFGGFNTGPELNDTWSWNGTIWTQLSPAASPSERDGASMAYDTATGNLVLFGGSGDSGNLADTWIWNGITWIKLSPATSPSARLSSSMDYDAATGNLVLFGGYTGSVALADTWIWNGTTWTQQTTSDSPAARSDATMSYDAASGNLVLFGGYSTTEGALSDTWSYQLTPYFTNTPIGSSTTSTATFTFTTGGSIGAPVVLTQGATGLDFTDAGTGTCTTNGKSHAYAVNDTCTVIVNFAPKYPGQRMGAIEMTDTSGNLLTTEFISGNGTGPLATFTPGTISTVAGSGTLCSPATATCGDGGLATAAAAGFDDPVGPVLDGAGDLYIADPGDFRIRKVTAATGILSTVAGTGAECNMPTALCGDGGSATSAMLAQANGIALDGAGNFYFSDNQIDRIRKVTAATGIITTIAGTGQRCSSPQSVCGDGGNATGPNAAMYSPSGVAVDGAGNVYFADTADNRIRMVTAATGILSTIAGDGNQCSGSTAPCGDGGLATAPGASLYFPDGVAVDGAGNIYIADTYDQRIRMVTAATGILTTIAGTGTACSPTTATCGDGSTATGANLYYPFAVAIDSAGNLYIGDSSDQRIRKVTAGTDIITTIAGTGTACSFSWATCGDGSAATSALLHGPVGLAVDGAGNLYIGDELNNRIRKVTASAATVNFADTAIGNTSPTQTVIVNNAGYDPAATNPLTFPIPAVGSTNPAVGTEFNVTNSSTCPQLTSSSGSAGMLAAGASCTYVLNYQPVATGAVAQFLTTTDNSMNVSGSTQNAVLTGSTGGLGVAVQNTSAPFDDTSIPLSFTVGYGGNTLPTGAPTLTVNGSATGVGVITCKAKAGHNLCTTTYNSTSLLPGQYSIVATQPADGTYSQTSGTGTLTLTLTP